jgi:tetratricopeptide (TPR) repeat protein
VLGRFSDARKQLDLVLKYAPDDPNICLQRDFIGGSLYDQERKPEEAFVRLTSVLSSHSEQLSRTDMRFMYEDIQLRRGFDAASIGRFEDALPILKECLSFDLKSTDRSTVLSDLGRCYSEIKEYESARDCFLQAIEIGLTMQTERDVHLLLAIACAHIGLYQDAKREFQLCEEKAGEYGCEIRKIYGWLSWVCGRLGEKAESARYASLANLV